MSNSHYTDRLSNESASAINTVGALRIVCKQTAYFRHFQRKCIQLIWSAPFFVRLAQYIPNYLVKETRNKYKNRWEFFFVFFLYQYVILYLKNVALVNLH